MKSSLDSVASHTHCVFLETPAACAPRCFCSSLCGGCEKGSRLGRASDVPQHPTDPSPCSTPTPFPTIFHNLRNQLPGIISVYIARVQAALSKSPDLRACLFLTPVSEEMDTHPIPCPPCAQHSDGWSLIWPSQQPGKVDGVPPNVMCWDTGNQGLSRMTTSTANGDSRSELWYLFLIFNSKRQTSCFNRLLYLQTLESSYIG